MNAFVWSSWHGLQAALETALWFVVPWILLYVIIGRLGLFSPPALRTGIMSGGPQIRGAPAGIWHAGLRAWRRWRGRMSGRKER